LIDGILGIDVSKNTLDASVCSRSKGRARSFANSPDGWRHLLDWLITQRVGRVHACLESTGRYSLGIACALNEAGHVVSIVNPAQIRDFARAPSWVATKLMGSMRRTFVSIANCSNPNLGRRLRTPIAGWVSCRRFELASLRV
jgi:Transposase